VDVVCRSGGLPYLVNSYLDTTARREPGLIARTECVCPISNLHLGRINLLGATAITRFPRSYWGCDTCSCEAARSPAVKELDTE
jgi:hypothetical protein